MFTYLGCGAAIIFFDKLIPKMFDMQLIFWIKGGLLKSNCLSHLIGCTPVAQWSNTLIIIIRLMVWTLPLTLGNKKTAKFLRSNLQKPLIRQQERSSVFTYLGCGAAIIFIWQTNSKNVRHAFNILNKRRPK